MSKVITISRQFGSGGRLIGKMAADRLGIAFYDKEIIELSAEKSGLASDFIRENEQKLKALSTYGVTSSFWGSGVWGNLENFESRIYAAEAETIERVAAQGPCVIVGRCADYVLRDKCDCLNVFIHADLSSRATRIMEVYKEADDERKAIKLAREADRLRARHYRYYTDAEWGEMDSYKLCLDSAKLGMDCCVELIVKAYEMM